MFVLTSMIVIQVPCIHMQVGMALKRGEWLSKTVKATCHPGSRMHAMGSSIATHC